MARLTQQAPEVSTVGIGNQQVTQNQSPAMGDIVAQGIKGVGNMIDTAANIYADNEAEGMVNSAISDIEAAQGSVEEWVSTPETFRQEQPNRQGLSVDDDEFMMIEAAVRSGGMTRDKARLMAASRLKSRIAEKPFAANQLREAASNILGFNIESEAARQYFAAFPTQQGGGENKALQAMQQRAQAISATTGADYDYVMGKIGQQELNALQVQNASEAAQQGLITATQFASTWHQEDGASAFGEVALQLAEAQAEGQTIDNAVVGNMIALRKEDRMRAFDDAYQAAGGTIGSEDYQRQVKTVNDRYDGLQDLIERVGFDNMTKIGLDRADDAIKGEAISQFGDFMVVTQGLGQQTAADVFSLLTNTREGQLETMLNRNPTLNRAYEFLDRDYEAFKDKFQKTTLDVFGGRPVAPEDEELADAIRAEEFNSGSEDGKQHIFRTLAEEGRNIKALSLSTKRRASQASEDERKVYKVEYERAVPQFIDTVAAAVANTNATALANIESSGRNINLRQRAVAERDGVYSLNTGADGMLSLAVNAPAFASPRATANMRSQIDKLNMFTRSMDKGWGEVVGTDRAGWKDRLTKDLDDASSRAKARYEGEPTAAVEPDVTDYFTPEELNSFRAEYEEFQQANPDVYVTPFDELVREAQRRLGAGGQ